MAKKPARRTKAITVADEFKIGQFQFGMSGNTHGSVKQQVHDGDTVGLSTGLNFSTRLLGVDAPEVSFTIRTKDNFIDIGHDRWKKFWTSGAWKNMPLKPAVRSHLSGRIGDGTAVAANHKKHASLAHKELESLIEADMQAAGRTKDDFRLFLAFSYEILDRYARFLCYLNADKINFTAPKRPNRLSYNERMLRTGAVAPYFIYPNIQPFLKIDPFAAANITPGGFWKVMKSDKAKALRAARQAVAAARSAGDGIFDAQDPLILLPYEIRFLARLGSKGPERHVIDLGKPGSNNLLRPEKYFTIKNIEDRLFIGDEFVPLFQLNGWKVS
jgi:endonuclease YncB( thermonuclease family)